MEIDETKIQKLKKSLIGSCIHLNEDQYGNIYIELDWYFITLKILRSVKISKEGFIHQNNLINVLMKICKEQEGKNNNDH